MGIYHHNGTVVNYGWETNSYFNWVKYQAQAARKHLCGKMAVAQELRRYGFSRITTLRYELSFTGQPMEWFIWLFHSAAVFVLLAETSCFKMYQSTYFRLASCRLSELRPGPCSIESLLSPTGTFWNASDAPELIQNASGVPQVWRNTD